MQSVIFRPDIRRLLLGAVASRFTGRVPSFAVGPLALAEFPDQALPNARSVRVRTRMAGICGTDLSFLKLERARGSAIFARNNMPRAVKHLGHEVVGEVVEVGTDVRSLRVRQRVVMLPGISCMAFPADEPCPMCVQGLPLLCVRRSELPTAAQIGGAWSSELIRNEAELVAVPDDLSDEDAVLIEPLACSIHAVLRRAPSDGETVIVIGCGIIGLGMIRALRALTKGVRIVAVARHAFQEEHAKAAGADVTLRSDQEDLIHRLAAEMNTDVLGSSSSNQMLRYGAAVVYDAVGTHRTLHQALRWTRPRGVVVIEGIAGRPGAFDWSPVWLREIDVVGAHGHGAEETAERRVHTFQLAIELLRSRQVDLRNLVTHRFALRDYRTALAVATDKEQTGCIKVIFEFPSK